MVSATIVARLIGITQAVVIALALVVFHQYGHPQWTIFTTALINAALTDAYARYARPCRWRR